MRSLLFALAALSTMAPFASAQAFVRRPQGPNIPIQQSSVPQMNPYTGGVPVTGANQLTPGVNGVPGSNVFAPQRYVNNPGSTYIINNYNNSNVNPFGYPSGGFNGMTAPSGQFYAVLGGPAPSNPFLGNVNPIGQTWSNTTGVAPNGQPWNFPFGYYNFNNLPQYPALVNAPVVGQSNGFLPPQQPAFVQPGLQNNFGIQQVPGLNGFGNR